MTVLEDVRNLIGAMSPEAICDDCIAKRLELSVRQHANHKTRELSNGPAFDRRRGSCSVCGSVKLVIRRI